MDDHWLDALDLHLAHDTYVTGSAFWQVLGGHDVDPASSFLMGSESLLPGPTDDPVGHDELLPSPADDSVGPDELLPSPADDSVGPDELLPSAVDDPMDTGGISASPSHGVGPMQYSVIDAMDTSDSTSYEVYEVQAEFKGVSDIRIQVAGRFVNCLADLRSRTPSDPLAEYRFSEDHLEILLEKYSSGKLRLKKARKTLARDLEISEDQLHAWYRERKKILRLGKFPVTGIQARHTEMRKGVWGDPSVSVGVSCESDGALWTTYSTPDSPNSQKH